MELFLKNYSEDQLKAALNEIKKGNMSKKMRGKITDILKTVNTQIKKAKAMGLIDTIN